jgi:hypothetical protein
LNEILQDSLYLCRKRHRSRSVERLREPRQHREVGVKGYALQAAYAKPVQPVIVLQATELALDRTATTVQIAEPLSVARDARKEPTAGSERQRGLILLRASSNPPRRMASPAF